MERPVGVNVDSFQNPSAAEKQTIVDQLKRSGVSFVCTSLRPDDENMNLAKNLQSEGIGLVLVAGPVFLPDAPLRPAWPFPARTLGRSTLACVEQAGQEFHLSRRWHYGGRQAGYRANASALSLGSRGFREGSVCIRGL